MSIQIYYSGGRFCQSTIRRYCHACGRITIFKDSKTKRQNARGKKVRTYFRYLCPKNHVWNVPEKQLKAKSVQKERIDNFLIRMSPDQSRSAIQKKIKAGLVKVNGKRVKSSDRIPENCLIEIQISNTANKSTATQDLAQDTILN